MSKPTFIQVAGNTYCWSGKYAIGGYLNPSTREAHLIDSGPDFKTAELIEQDLTDKGYTLSSILLTHAHLASAKGASYLKEMHPYLKCYASPLSATIVNDPGASAVMNMLDYAPQQQDARAEILVTESIPYHDGVFFIQGVKFSFVTLPGHFPGMFGILTPDQVLFCADALFGARTLSKQKLLMFTDPGNAKQSLQKLKSIRASHYVLYHGGLEKDISSLIQQNLQCLDDMYQQIQDIIKHYQGQTFDIIVQKLMQRYGIDDHEDHYELVRVIARSNINQLLKEGRIRKKVAGGILMYSTEQPVYDGAPSL
ncbi:MBL fold metallo-hydrolase [Paenibacillus sp. JSM ZJ436]|uniref:MBL fold metallo-hydrolase n=1 Tax=Paenibacillus sp. JSM ZJ436 TaxID=3376190 RepID=UPI00378B2EA7